MKRIYSFLFAAVALFAAASCQKEIVGNDAPAAKGEPFTITAVADAQTKTALNADDDKKVNWTAGDAIAVFDATGEGVEFTTDITEPAAQAVFEAEDFTAPESFVALYPYQTNLTFAEGVVSGLELKAAQTAKAADFDKTAALTFAKGENKEDLKFNNLYSLLKFTVVEEGINEVKVAATSGSLAGKVTLNVEKGALTVVENQGVSEVTLTGEFTKDGVYYLCVLPGTYAGFSISLNGYTVKTKASDAVLAANTIYDLGSIERTKSGWCLAGTHNSFSDNDEMYIEGDYYVIKNINIKSEFKFKKKGTWDGAYALSNNPLSVNKKNTPSMVSWNIEFENKTSHAGAIYDVYLKKDFSEFYVMTPGAKIENIGKTKEITIYCETSHTKLWAYTKYDVYSFDAYDAWPGKVGTDITIGGKTYKKWTASLPIDVLNYCHFIFNGTGSQTSDANSGPFKVEDEIYLSASGANKPIILKKGI